MSDSERPSPFTVPQPTNQFEGAASEPRPAHSMTVGGLIRNLTAFADFHEGTSAAIHGAEPVMKPWHTGNRDAIIDWKQREFRSAVAIDRVRAYALVKYGADLTIRTARQFLGDLIRTRGLTVEAAEALTLEAAMGLLDAAEPPGAQLPGNDERFIERLPAGPDDVEMSRRELALPAGATATLAGEKPAGDAFLRLLTVYTDGQADDRLKKAAALVEDDQLTVGEKLEKIDALVPFPPTASARQLGDLLRRKKQAVLKTNWWKRNRKGEKASEVGRRRARHRERAEGLDATEEDDPR
jgi:hypothetical protein